MAAVQAQLVAQGKRKEKARIAARARRSQEASIIMEMASELEISQEKLRRIDKATIVRLAIDYISAHEKLVNPDADFTPNEAHLQPSGSLRAERVPVQVPVLKMRSGQPTSAPAVPLAARAGHKFNRPLQAAARDHEHEHAAQEHEDRSDLQCALDEFAAGEHVKENTKKAGKHYQDSDSEEGERLEDTHKLKHQHVDLEHEFQHPQNQHLHHQHHQHHHHHNHQQQQQQLEQAIEKQSQMRSNEELKRPPLYSMPKLTTASIFAPKTQDNANSYFLMIEANDNGKAAFVLKPDTEIQDEDDLTHLAPQAGDISISFETDPLDGIPIDDLLKT